MPPKPFLFPRCAFCSGFQGLDAALPAQAMSGLESVGGSTGHTPKEEPPMPTVKPNKEFVAYIVDQLEISEKDAKSALRKHDNDLQRTIEHLITC